MRMMNNMGEIGSPYRSRSCQILFLGQPLVNTCVVEEARIQVIQYLHFGPKSRRERTSMRKGHAMESKAFTTSSLRNSNGTFLW